MNDKLKHRIISYDTHNTPYKSAKMQDHHSYTIKKTNSLIADGSSHMRFTIKMAAYSNQKHIASSKHKEMNIPYQKQQPQLDETKLRHLQKKLSEHKLGDLGISLSKKQINIDNSPESPLENAQIGTHTIKIEKSKKIKEKKHSIYFTKGNNHQLLKQIFVDKFGFKEAFSKETASICWLQSSNQKQSSKRSRNVYQDHLPQIAKRKHQHVNVIYNYLQGQSQLTNKQKMFKNMRNSFPESIGKYIPRSFIVDFRKNQFEVHEHLLQFISYYFKKVHNKKPRTKSVTIKNYFVDITLSEKQLNKIITATPNTYDTPTNIEKQNQTHNQPHDPSTQQALWILKPTYLNRGRGIHLFSTLKQFSKLLSQSAFEISVKMYSENMKPKTYIIQQYIERPLLINGYKFDMRFWALMQVVKVNGKKTLKAYLFKHGYLRLASIKYDINSVEQINLQGQIQKQESESKSVHKQQKGVKKERKDYINNRFIHLTNNAVQKQAKEYGHLCEGNQMSLQQMISHFQQKDKNTPLTLNLLMQNIEKIVKQSILSVKQDLISANSSKTFQLLGYDFLLDQSYNLWFIEVNCNPCLEQSSELVGSLLRKMLEGLVKLISLQEDKGPDNSDGWIELF